MARLTCSLSHDELRAGIFASHSRPIRGFILAALILCAPISSKAEEGWWPTNWHHSSELMVDISRLSAIAKTVVALGPETSGTLISSRGLLLTSAKAVRNCIEANIQNGSLKREALFVALNSDQELPCPSLVAWRTAIAREISKDDNNPQNIQGILDTCKTLGTRRRCRIEERGKQTLLIEEEMMRDLRLAFWPGQTLANLGGLTEVFSDANLRLDIALLRVPASQTPDKGINPAAISQQIPKEDATIWVAHHPEPTFRNLSAPEVQAYFEKVLPVFAKRFSKTETNSLENQRIKLLLQLSPELIEQARRRDLAALRFIRQAFELSPQLEHPFTTGLKNLQKAPLAKLATYATPSWISRNWTYSQLPQLAKQLPAAWALTVRPDTKISADLDTLRAAIKKLQTRYKQNLSYRKNAWQVMGLDAIGIDGDGTLRLSRGKMIASDNNPYRWRQVLEYAKQAKLTNLGLPKPISWSPELPLGFQVDADLAPFGTGGPAFDNEGNLIGVVSGGDKNTVAGLVRYQAQQKVSVISMISILRILNTYKARKLAKEIGH